jgi:glycosyltransferase involved in cell wall biosynthesis
VAEILKNPVSEETRRVFTKGNLEKIKEEYNWEKVNSRYENTLSDVIAAK